MSKSIDLSLLTLQQLEVLQGIVQEKIARGEKISLEEAADSVFLEQMVDVPTFIESPDYMGLPRWSPGSDTGVFPGIVDLLIKVDSSDVREFYLNVGKGSGKSVFCSLLLARENYKDCILRNPQAYYKQMAESPIVSLNMSISEKHAKRILFRYYLAYLKNSKWFQNKFEQVGLEVHFPNNVMGVCGHSRSTSFLGYNTRVGVCDEADWFIADDNRDQAQEIFDVMLDSAKTRYITAYKVGAISASREHNGFMATHYKQVVEEWQKAKDDSGQI